MFERYSLDAQKILTLAESIAFSYSHETITELHLFLALIKSPESELAKIASAAGLKAQRIEACLFSEHLKMSIDDVSLYMEYSDNLKNIVDDATKIADKNHESSVSILDLELSLVEHMKAQDLARTGFSAKDILIAELKKYHKKSAELDKIIDLHRMGEKDLDPLVGREDILSELVLVLKRRNKPNAILVGEPGVGKSFIVEHLAKLIKDEKIPELKDKTIFELDLASTVGGTKYRGEFEEKIKKIIKKVMDDGNAILFIDEIHNIVKAGGAEGAIDCSNIIKPYLSRGDIQIIGATTYDEYEEVFSQDKALKRRFQMIKVQPNTKEETLAILQRLAPIYASHYSKEVDLSLLPALIDYADRYLPNLSFPDKAIDILDNSLAGAAGTKLRASDVKMAIENFFHIKVDEKFSPHDIVAGIRERIHGQEKVMRQLEHNLKLISINSNKVADRPLATFLFIGPSGVGKSLTAKLLAEAYFHSAEAFLKIDMTNFQDQGSVSRLIGTSPGYIGYKDESPLIKTLKSKPHSLILLDEIEKAHPAVLDIFMNIFEEGYLTNGEGERVDCTNAIFILTSNLSFNQSELFSSRLSQNHIDKKKVERQLSDRFRYEFVARIDDIFIFDRLTEEAILKITKETYDEIGLSMEVSQDFDDKDYRGEIDKYGARAIKKHCKEVLLESNEV